jgi:hypothetical protein
MNFISIGGLWLVIAVGAVVVIGLAVLAVAVSRSPRR